MYKSKRFRKIFVRTPGGKTTVHHRERKPSPARCALTGQILPGVPRERPAKMVNLPKTKKRPERPYGGILSSRAMRLIFKQRVRGDQQ